VASGDRPRYLTGVTRSGDAPRPDPGGPASDEVPRLPRGRGLRLSRVELMRIAGIAIVLVFLLATQRRCADAVSRFVTGFGDQGSAVAPRPGAARAGGSEAPAAAGSATPASAAGSAELDLDRYERLRPGMTEAETRAVIERAKARAAARKAEGDPGH
jgi:hypothetical protein